VTPDAGAFRGVARLWREIRSTTLVVIAGALAASTAIASIEWRSIVRDNRLVAALRDGKDITVDLQARSELLLARAAFFAKRGEADRARAFVEAIDRRGDAAAGAQGRYLLGNAFLRKAFKLLESGELDAAGPYVNLARGEYRRALQLAPEFWDAKFNLDVAARLMRDFPQFEPKGGDELYADPKKLWTDVPGAPKGLP
jgi:mxaK protein